MKTYTYRELVKKLKKHDKKFEIWENRGKGSEHIIYHPNVNGRAESYPIKHHGDGTEIKIGHYPAICRRFGLPKNFFK